MPDGSFCAGGGPVPCLPADLARGLWVPVAARLYATPAYGLLPDTARAVYLELMMLAKEHGAGASGETGYGADAIAWLLRRSKPATRRALTRLAEAGMVGFDATGRVVVSGMVSTGGAVVAPVLADPVAEKRRKRAEAKARERARKGDMSLPVSPVVATPVATPVASNVAIPQGDMSPNVAIVSPAMSHDVATMSHDVATPVAIVSPLVATPLATPCARGSLQRLEIRDLEIREGNTARVTAPVGAPEPVQAPARAPTPAGLICVELRKLGLVGVNPADPRLLNLLDGGVSHEEVIEAGKTAVERGKNFAYALAVVRGQREDAARAPALPPPAAAAVQKRPEPRPVLETFDTQPDPAILQSVATANAQRAMADSARRARAAEADPADSPLARAKARAAAQAAGIGAITRGIVTHVTRDA